jgi:hypothetical protein
MPTERQVAMKFTPTGMFYVYLLREFDIDFANYRTHKHNGEKKS